MIVDIEYKVSLTQSELQRIIAAHCGFPLDSKIQLTIEGEQQPVEEDWIDVPSDWDKPFCPTEFPEGTRIDVMFRDGEIKESTPVYNWEKSNWRQRKVPWNIEKYRISKG